MKDTTKETKEILHVYHKISSRCQYATVFVTQDFRIVAIILARESIREMLPFLCTKGNQ